VRRRIVIGGVAIIAVIGVLAFSEPRKGSTEWHKREYLRARAGRWTDDAVNFVRRALGMGIHSSELDERKRDIHRDALLKLGFLEERTFVVSNREADIVAREATRAHPGIWEKQLWTVYLIDTNELMVVDVREEMPQWEELIHKADVPENGR
jgi:hypothetical protein